MADAQLVLPPGFRVTDANDEPVAGAKLKFYAAGTSTPMTVYSDAGLLTALGTTVECDDGGYPLSGGGSKTLIYVGPDSYKLVITDADDAVLVTHDNIKGAPVVSGTTTSAYPQTPVITRTVATVIGADYETYRGRLINANPTGGAFAITLPNAITVQDGFRVGIRHDGSANTVTLRSIGSQGIRTIGQSSATSFALTGMGHTVWLVSNGADWTVDTEVPALMSSTAPYFRVTDRIAGPIGSPAPGSRYIISDTPTGAWATLGFDEGDIVEADGNGSWLRYVPFDGCMGYVVDEQILTQWRDGEWIDLSNVTAPSSTDLWHAIFEHQAPNGTGGGSGTNGAWTQRTLNTQVVNTIPFAELNSNYVWLPAGKYLVIAQQKFSVLGSEGSSTGRLAAQQRIGAGTAVLAASNLYGLSGYVGAQASGAGLTFFASTNYGPTDTFILDVTTAGTIDLEYWKDTGTLGLESSEPDGAPEVYARLQIISLSSMQGPPGPQGPQGIQGEQGIQGFPGDNSLGYFPVDRAGDTMSGPLDISISDATTAADYLKLVPTDFDTGKPYLFAAKGTVVDAWRLGLWDGTDNGGTLEVDVDLLRPNGRMQIKPPTPGADTTLPALHIYDPNQRPASSGLDYAGSVGRSAFYAETVRTGGEGGYGNVLIFHRVAASLAPAEFDSGVTSWVNGEKQNGGSVFGGWFGANTPHSGVVGHELTNAGGTGTPIACGAEFNAGQRWSDPGFLNEPGEGATPCTVGIMVVPDVIPSVDPIPETQYPGSFGVNKAHSIWGHKWWVADNTPYNTVREDGVAFNVGGSSAASAIPGLIFRGYGYWNQGFDLTGAVLTNNRAFEMANGHILSWNEDDAFIYGSSGTPGVLTLGGDVGINIETNGVTHSFRETGAGIGGGALIPMTDDGGALGSATNRWSDAFWASGAVMNYNNGALTVTHSAGALTQGANTNGSLSYVVDNDSAGDAAAAQYTLRAGTQSFNITLNGENHSSGSVIGFYTAQSIGQAFYTGGTQRFLIRGDGYIEFVHALVNAANDGAAASGGVPVGCVYRNGSALMMRVS